MKLARAGYSELDPKLLIGYSRYGNFVDIRLAAISALAILAVDGRYALLTYVIGIARGDPNPAVRVHAACSLTEAYAWLLCHYSAEVVDDVPFGVERPKAKNPKERIIDALKRVRSDISSHDEIRQQLWQIIT
jgi:transcription initiation factor TFIID subunit 2